MYPEYFKAITSSKLKYAVVQLQTTLKCIVSDRIFVSLVSIYILRQLNYIEENVIVIHDIYIKVVKIF